VPDQPEKAAVDVPARYDLCIPHAHWDEPRVVALRETLGDPALRSAVEALGGYDVTPMGTIAREA
jgi:hypothetical protein